jgi:hypothetical protein
MKKLLLLIACTSVFSGTQLKAQDDKSKRPSPPAKATQTIASGAVITIDYSSPSLKGRTMGKDVEPMKGQVWRAGANEATVFATSKDITVEGKKLPAGKYGFYTISGDAEWTVIFSKVSTNWGADGYKEADDALRVKVKPGIGAAQEKLQYAISKEGKVSLRWGTLDLSFNVK